MHFYHHDLEMVKNDLEVVGAKLVQSTVGRALCKTSVHVSFQIHYICYQAEPGNLALSNPSPMHEVISTPTEIFNLLPFIP